MADSHKRKISRSQDDLDHAHKRFPGHSSLQTKITELIDGQEFQGSPTSGSLIHGFIQRIWPKIRDDYCEMTRELENGLKRALKELDIDAEVSSRVKEDASILKTLKRREEGLRAHEGNGFISYQHIFNEMHDLSGLRIVLKDRGHLNKAQELIQQRFKQQKLPAHFDPNREVGRFWKKPWFGAYETHNHRVQLSNDNRETIEASTQYFGVMFEIQLTTFSDNLYNKLAHALLYKADPGLVTEQEEMVIDVSHGLARCFELCMRILRPKLHGDIDARAGDTAEDVTGHNEQDATLAQSVVDRFESDLHNQPKSDRIALLLRRVLDKTENAKDQACLKDLRVSDPRDDKMRIEETKGGLLKSSYNWILEDDDFIRWRQDGQKQPFWITGDPGKGKTMMLCGIIDKLRKESEANISYFFCQGTDERINTGTAVLRGLLFLLCKQQEALISHVREKYDSAGEKLFKDRNAWSALSGIFRKVLGDLSSKHIYLIVDALDECLPGGEDSRQYLVKLILELSKSYPTVKWIVSSRKWQEFDKHLRNASHLSLESKSKRECVSAAVGAYIDSMVNKLGDQDFSTGMVTEIKHELQRKSEGTFLWVAIVCKTLEDAQEHNVRQILQDMPEGLDDLYDKLLQDIDALRYDDPGYCKSVLRAVTVALRPLTLEELQELAGLPQSLSANTTAKMCKSLIIIRDGSVFFVHQSAKDYLSEKWKNIFHSAHESMFSRSVEAMKRVLKRDIYKLGHPGIPINEVKRPDIDPLVSIRYSCVHWITHFFEAQLWDAEKEVYDFLTVHFLHWFEALSLIRSASACVHALRDLVNSFEKGSRTESLPPLVRDMYRFAQTYGAIIGKVPLQAYSSALIFSPASSLTRQLFTSQEPEWIVQKPRVEPRWNNCLATLTDHTDAVSAVAFSPDGHRIVSGSDDCTVKIWDAESGTEYATFQNRNERGPILSVAFDVEGRFITSNSSDGTIRTWNTETGTCISTRKSAEEQQERIVFSSDKRRFAHCSLRGDIHIENIGGANETEDLKLEGHTEQVMSVAFSHDGCLVASGAGDANVKIWNAVTGAEISTLRGHSDAISSVCFSSDDRRVVSGSWDGTIKIWDVQDIERRAEPSFLQNSLCYSDPINSITISLDGSRIASMTPGHITIWDAGTKDKIRTINRKLRNEFGSVTFSPDGRYIAASGGAGNDAVIILDAESGANISHCDRPCEGPLAVSLHGRYIAMWYEETAIIKDAERNLEVVTFSGHTGDITFLAFSPKDCQIAASASDDKTIKIWNAFTGEEISTLRIEVDTHLLRFDATGTYLYIRSEFPFQDPTWSCSTLPYIETVLPEVKQAGYGFNKDRSWITWHGQNVLWLPPEFRGTPILGMPPVGDVLPHMISIGCASGRVWWLTFSSQNHPFERCGQANN